MSITDNDTITPITPITVTPITETVDSHLQAYAMADVERRNALIAANWNVDGELVDPPLAGRGHTELSGLTELVLTHYAGHRFVRTTAVDAHHRFGRYGWDLVAPDGSIAVSGIDVVELDDEGKLLRIVGFFGGLESR